MKPWRSNLLLPFAGILLALGLLEGFARLYPLWPDQLATFDPRLGAAYIPGARGWWVNIADPFEFRSRVAINSLGLRDHEIEIDKPEGIRRVLLLGDSMVAGMEVALDETFAKQLERSFQRNGERIEVINAGHYGYATDQELLFYRFWARRLHADLVVLCFLAANDIADNTASYTSIGPKPYFLLTREGLLELRNFPVPPPPPPPRGWLRPLKGFLYAHSKLYRFAGDQIKRQLPGVEHLLEDVGVMRVPPRLDSRPRAYLLPLTDKLEGGWVVTQAILRELHKEVEADGAKLLIVVMADPGQFGEAAAELGVRVTVWGERMAGFCAGEDIECFDLYPAFQGRSDLRELFFSHDGHLTPKGHEVAAAALYPYLRRFLAQKPSMK